MNITLKRCPFCGGGQTDVHKRHDHLWVVTHWCEPNFPMPPDSVKVHGATLADAVVRWNNGAGC